MKQKQTTLFQCFSKPGHKSTAATSVDISAADATTRATETSKDTTAKEPDANVTHDGK